MEGETRTGNKCKIFKNNKFRLVHKGKEKLSWRCTTRLCNIRIHTDVHGDVLERDVHHSHADSVKDVGVDVLRCSVKRRANDSIDSRPSKLIRQELSKMDSTEALRTKDIKNLKMAMYRARRKRYGALPKSATETVENVKAAPIATNRNENMVLTAEVIGNENGLVIYSCVTNLRHLCQAETILGDGTCFVSPRYFCQLYTIHGYFNHHYVPLVFCLLPRKTCDIYELTLQKISGHCKEFGFTLAPKHVLLDFERAARVAFQNVFPSASALCCRFHFAQAVMKKIGSIGLKSKYTDKDSETSHWLKQFFALPMLPPSEVADAFAFDIMSNVPSDSQHKDIEQFADYMVDTFISPESPNPPTLWAAGPECKTPRTNNGAETFHRHIKADLKCKSPNIFLFQEHLLLLQEEIYIRIQSTMSSVRVSAFDNEKKEFVRKACEKYCRGHMTRQQYLATICHRFLPVQ